MEACEHLKDAMMANENDSRVCQSCQIKNLTELNEELKKNIDYFMGEYRKNLEDKHSLLNILSDIRNLTIVWQKDKAGETLKQINEIATEGLKKYV